QILLLVNFARGPAFDLESGESASSKCHRVDVPGYFYRRVEQYEFFTRFGIFYRGCAPSQPLDPARQNGYISRIADGPRRRLEQDLRIVDRSVELVLFLFRHTGFTGTN